MKAAVPCIDRNLPFYLSGIGKKFSGRIHGAVDYWLWDAMVNDVEKSRFRTGLPNGLAGTFKAFTVAFTHP
jgi:hypothetical protein